ncbi:MAG TPA: ECF transporter S component, partial [Lachnospiraceae bacterium]|nr:ECF transporter S component [Lachnospiraceae bacterium]
MNFSELFASAKENAAFLGVSLIVIIIVAVIAGVSEKLIGCKHDERMRTKRIAFIGIFSAIAAILMYLEIPLWFAPPFYKIDFSEVPVLICAFAYGPVAGVIAELLKVVLKLFIKGTSSAFVGDLANFIIGCTMILPASIIYHIKKTRKTALLGMTAGTVIMTIFGSIFNAVYLLPTFSVLYGMPLEAIIAMGTAVNVNITDITTL